MIWRPPRSTLFAFTTVYLYTNGIETGETYVIIDLDNSFDETIGKPSFTIQKILKNTKHAGITGDWVAVSSNLKPDFSAGVASRYALQLAKLDANGIETGETYVISDLDNSFDETTGKPSITLQKVC